MVRTIYDPVCVHRRDKTPSLAKIISAAAIITLLYDYKLFAIINYKFLLKLLFHPSIPFHPF